MNFNKIIPLFALALTMAACGNSPKQQENENTLNVEIKDEKTGITSLTPFTQSDTITINGKQYNYTYEFAPVDSLPHVINSQNNEYLDNMVKLTICQGETKVTEKTFLKSSFKSYIPEELWKESGLVGFSYNLVRKERNAFYFIATIGDPDLTADVSYPLEIRITTDGGMSISKAENLDTEPLHNGMTIDASDDGV